MQALFHTVAAKRSDQGLIHHSDRGSIARMSISSFFASLACKPR